MSDPLGPGMAFEQDRTHTFMIVDFGPVMDVTDERPGLQGGGYTWAALTQAIPARDVPGMLDGIELDIDATMLLEVNGKAAGADARVCSDDELFEGVAAVERARALLAAAEAHLLGELDARGASDVAFGLKIPTWLAREAGLSRTVAKRRLTIGNALRARLEEADVALMDGRLRQPGPAPRHRRARRRLRVPRLRRHPAVLARHAPHRLVDPRRAHRRQTPLRALPPPPHHHPPHRLARPHRRRRVDLVRNPHRPNLLGPTTRQTTRRPTTTPAPH